MRRSKRYRYNGPIDNSNNSNNNRNGNGTMMPPISQPGQRESRRHTMREEILRIPNILGWQCFLGASIVVFAALVLAIIGPVVGVIVGLCAIVYTARFVRWADVQTRHLFAPVFVVLTVLWLYTGYDICASVWIWNPALGWHVSIKIIIVTFYTLAIGAYSWAEYILWIEVTDPNHPSPRHASQRDNPHIPFITKETYGGQLLPEISTLPSLPSRTITIQLNKDDNGKHTESVSHIPDTINWHKFFYAVSHHGKGFTEATAKAYSIPLIDTKDQAGQLIVLGMRTVREQFLARGWLEWKNQSVHERGIRVTDKGLRIMEAIGKED